MITAVEALLVLLVLAAIGYPLYATPAAAEGGIDEGDDYHKLLSAKEAAFVAIKDLEFDYKTGKIAESDYAPLKARLEADAVDLMKRLDGAQAEAAAPRKEPKPKGRFCAACGAKAGADDRFCSSCGKPLKK